MYIMDSCINSIPMNFIIYHTNISTFFLNLVSYFRCAALPWTIITLTTASAAFIIVLYSVEWGKRKSEEWLSSFILSVVESILVLDPILVNIKWRFPIGRLPQFFLYHCAKMNMYLKTYNAFLSGHNPFG